MNADTRSLVTMVSLCAAALAVGGCSSSDTGESSSLATAGSAGASAPGFVQSMGTAGSSAGSNAPEQGPLAVDTPDAAAPTSGDAGNGVDAALPSPGNDLDAALPPACVTTGSQGFIVGDSYVTGFASPALQPELAKLAPIIGQFQSYAGAGCSMVSGGACTGFYGNVPLQLDFAIAANPNAKFIIMDGGGNDVLLCDTATYPGCNTVCSKAGSSAQKVCTDIVNAAIGAAGSLMQKAAAAGIRDIIYFFYPHVPAANGGYREILDYAEPLARAACDSTESKTGGKSRCYFVDLVEPFKTAFGDAAPAQFEAVMGIHPLQAGVELMSKEITHVMAAHCLGEQSGCCAP